MQQPADYDVIVIGAGPSGLAAAVTLAFEGKKVLVVDGSNQAGGQAGTSHMIENLLGFPDGISGPDLTNRLLVQAKNFGVDMLMPFRAQRLDRDGSNCVFTVTSDDRERKTALSVIIATGVQYRRLPAINLSLYHGRGVAYGSPPQTPPVWRNKHVGVVGGANSAAQAALFLSKCEGCKVSLLVRGGSLEDGMSAHVISHFTDAPNVDILLNTSVEEVLGNADWLTGVRVQTPKGSQVVDLDHLFVQIGSTPHTAVFEGMVALDSKGYIVTDADIPAGAWKCTHRNPRLWETSVEGIFACGDVRAAHARKRVATGIGDGVNAASNAMDYLKLECVDCDAVKVAA